METLEVETSGQHHDQNNRQEHKTQERSLMPHSGASNRAWHWHTKQYHREMPKDCIETTTDLFRITKHTKTLMKNKIILNVWILDLKEARRHQWIILLSEHASRWCLYVHKQHDTHKRIQNTWASVKNHCISITKLHLSAEFWMHKSFFKHISKKCWEKCNDSFKYGTKPVGGD